MEANICDINHLDADVLLPPRKRLLAGFKKQSSDGDGASLLPVVGTPLHLSASPTSPSPQSPPSSTPCSPSSNCERPQIQQLRLLLKAAGGCKSSRLRRRKISAAKAVTAAKSALALVAFIS
ncbi:hypothetical protein NC653_018922 [Populus alba x Populus x berolinensis]|uniref:Uncharacterized protein n=1 Tax=Populus alba x Populus x berolinensis TaxID=444605 RepID=A0AAD6QHJ3_9ROSI|nr:hypothetical protein NC653_018922 [Populus alba x Populus x berolinensis]